MFSAVSKFDGNLAQEATPSTCNTGVIGRGQNEIIAVFVLIIQT